MMTPKKLLLFDLDGTLVDSVPDLAAAIDIMQTELGLPTRGIDKVRHWVGNGMDRLVKRALTDAMDAEPDADLYARASEIFTTAYAENACVHSRLYAGVASTLAQLHTAGYRLGCITNKRARFTEIVLAEMQIADYFSIVISGDSLPLRKPDPLPLHHAMNTLEFTPPTTLMIGDSMSDLHAANAAGVDAIAVSYGYHQDQDLTTASPLAIIDEFTSLAGILLMTNVSCSHERQAVCQ
ncbi:MAG: phosphoglycolate phosphatase [Gammaproteobacteria bacterium]